MSSSQRAGTVILLSVMSKETAPVSLGWLLLGLVSRSWCRFWPHPLLLRVADSCFSGLERTCNGSQWCRSSTEHGCGQQNSTKVPHKPYKPYKH